MCSWLAPAFSWPGETHISSSGPVANSGGVERYIILCRHWSSFRRWLALAWQLRAPFLSRLPCSFSGSRWRNPPTSLALCHAPYDRSAVCAASRAVVLSPRRCVASSLGGERSRRQAQHSDCDRCCATRETILVARVGRECGAHPVSFIVAPHWPRWWPESLAADPNRSAAVARSGGFLLLLSGLKWRRPEARLLLLLSIVPQTLGHYDALLLFFVPDRASQAIALAALSHFLNLLNLGDRPATLNDAVVASGIRVVHYLYLPSLLFVLSRPNRGTIPDWAEKVARRLPAWLQGAPEAHSGEGPQRAREFFKHISPRIERVVRSRR